MSNISNDLKVCQYAPEVPNMIFVSSVENNHLYIKVNLIIITKPMVSKIGSSGNAVSALLCPTDGGL